MAMEVEVEAMEEVDMAEGADMKTNVNTVSGVCYVVKSTLDISVVLLRPPPSTRSRGGLSQISDLIDIDYETLVLLLGVAGAGASWVLYQTILTKGRRSFQNVKDGNIGDNASLLDKLSDFINFGEASV